MDGPEAEFQFDWTAGDTANVIAAVTTAYPYRTVWV